MVDYHVHSNHSVDARDPMAAMVERAREMGIRELGFADHLDLNPADSGYMALDLDRCLAEVSELRSTPAGPVIRAGVEVGEPHLYRDQLRVLLGGRPLDFVIGGVHWVGDDLVGTDEFFGRHADPVCAYLEEVRAMVKAGGFHIVAHLDFPTRYMAGWGESWDPATCRQLIENILETIIDRGMALEVNTAGYRRALGRPHPPAEVLRWYRDMGGTLLTLGSDAHTASAVGSGIPEAVDILHQLGFESVTGYRDGQPHSLPLQNPKT